MSWDASEAISKFSSRVVPPHLARDATFREGFAQLARLGLSFESWQYHPQLSDAIDLARAFPDTTIILNHVGGSRSKIQRVYDKHARLPQMRRALETYRSRLQTLMDAT